MTTILSFCVNSSVTFAQNAAPPHSLRIGAGFENPIGFHNAQPVFSWKLLVSPDVKEQAAYRIQVSKDESMKDKSSVLWDSKKVESAESTYVPYAGPQLKSRDRFYWRVKVWDQENRGSEWSEPASCELALLTPDDWQASWISIADAASQAEPEKSEQLSIQSMTYGILETGKEKFIDITAKATAALRDGQAVLSASNKFAGGDPAVGKQKEAKIVYTLNGKQHEVSIKEGQTLRLPQDHGQPSEGRREYVQYFRRPFDFNASLKSARIHVTARGLYELSLNGQPVGNDKFVPGWTDYNKRIDTLTYDVTDQIKMGSNVLAAKVGHGWYAGRLGWTQTDGHYGQQPELLLQLELQGEDGELTVIGSDDTWKGTRDGPIRSSSIYDGEAYDGTKALVGWTEIEFDDSGWSPVTVGTAGARTTQLCPKPSAPVRHTETLATQEITQPIPGRYVFDLGQNMVGQARIALPVRKGQTIQLRFAELLNPDGTLYTDNYRGAKSTDTYIAAETATIEWQPSFTFHGFRYVELSGLAERVKPKPAWVTGIVLRSDLKKIGKFKSSHEKLNQLQSNITWGQRGNFFDIPTDCPQRDERLGRTGDAQVFCPTSLFNFDCHAFWLSWLGSMRDAQRDDGSIPDVVPNILGEGVSPGWGDCATIIPWQVYVRTGDIRVLRDNYEMMTRWLKWYDGKSQDGIVDVGGYLDWLQPIPKTKGEKTKGDTPADLIATAYYAHSTRIAHQSASRLGESEDATRLLAQYETICNAFVDKFLDTDGRLTTDHETQTGYLLPLAFGLVDGEMRILVQDRLSELVAQADNHLGTGFLGTALLNRQLDESRNLDQAYAVLFQDSHPSWFYSIDQGATTLWERWNSFSVEEGFGPAQMNSFNHYAYGAVGNWMYERIAGLAPDPNHPGYKHFYIQPQLHTPLTSASAKLETNYGIAASMWKIEEGRLSIDCRVPPNTTATLKLPPYTGELITERQGEPGWSPKGNLKKRKAIKLGPGEYHFEADAMAYMVPAPPETEAAATAEAAPNDGAEEASTTDEPATGPPQEPATQPSKLDAEVRKPAAIADD